MKSDTLRKSNLDGSDFVCRETRNESLDKRLSLACLTGTLFVLIDSQQYCPVSHACHRRSLMFRRLVMLALASAISAFAQTDIPTTPAGTVPVVLTVNGKAAAVVQDAEKGRIESEDRTLSG